MATRAAAAAAAAAAGKNSPGTWPLADSSPIVVNREVRRSAHARC